MIRTVISVPRVGDSMIWHGDEMVALVRVDECPSSALSIPSPFGCGVVVNLVRGGDIGGFEFVCGIDGVVKAMVVGFGVSTKEIR